MREPANPEEPAMTLTISTNESDSSAAEAVVNHHAQLLGSLALLADGVVSATAAGDVAATLQARDRLRDWCKNELLPHAQAEEHVLYPAAGVRPEGRLLIDGMLAEHSALAKLVDALDGDDPTRSPCWRNWSSARRIRSRSVISSAGQKCADCPSSAPRPDGGAGPHAVMSALHAPYDSRAPARSSLT